jgi:excisionase family DNA binding protein
MADIEIKSMLTSSEIAKALGVTMKTIERMRNRGRITGYKIFKHYRYDLEECKAALTTKRPYNRKEPTAEKAREL